jgi:carbamoyltransferase
LRRNYIGLANSFHDSAIAIVDADGNLIFAEATERHLQQKRAINVPPDTYQRVSGLFERYCDKRAQTVIAQTWSADAARVSGDALIHGRQREAHLAELFGRIPDVLAPYLAINKFSMQSHSVALSHVGRALECDLINDGYTSEQIVRRYYDHHLTHAATAAFTSDFNDGVCAVVDGYGEGPRSPASFTGMVA